MSIYRLTSEIRKTILSTRGEGNAILKKLLYLLSVFYGAVSSVRGYLYTHNYLRTKRLPCLVISVGNITMGGTGKTPMVRYLCRIFQQHDLRVAVLSRGYKGTHSKKGGIVSNGSELLLPPGASGDEPWMLADSLENVPVVVGRNRYRSGMIAKKSFDPQVLVLDDGFQHLQLQRDLDIVLLDGTHPLGNGHVFPRGTLRESVSGLDRCDALIFTRAGSGDPAKHLVRSGIKTSVPCFASVHKPYIHSMVEVSKDGQRFVKTGDLAYPDPGIRSAQKVIGFSGIADNHGFEAAVRGFGFDIAGFLGYEDHHWYDEKDLEAIFDLARKKKAELIVTTRKDFVRIDKDTQWPVDVVVVDVKIEFPDDGFERWLEDSIGKLPRN
ncbi:MAG: tetraacyldisaccharide 4'-kinase [Desulfobacteraceae bacterium]|nr:tetraacyldisaccharide 4'-kinase [Desulfobacteraceae bacterium]